MDSCCCFDFHRSRRKSTKKERRSSTVVHQICSAVEGRNLAGHDMLLAIAAINHHHNGSQSARGGRGKSRPEEKHLHLEEKNYETSVE
nr:hypothetical protein Itr_chr01CG04190 [Ipomoea trifida]